MLNKTRAFLITARN